jgi:hypothetical protein
MANADQWQKLIIPAVGLETKRWLAEWRWLVPEVFSPLWLNCFGDWVFASRDGEIYFLDLLEGSFKSISPSNQVLSGQLNREENQNRWLMADWVGICRERGLLLSNGQCYGWKVAPVLGGKFEFDNIQVFDLLVYECIMGQIHRQLQGLPEGYVITVLRLGK